MENGRKDAHVFIPYVGALELIHKNQQKFPHLSPIFYRGQKVPNFEPNFDTTPVRSTAISDWRTFSESKTILIVVPHVTNRVGMGPTNSEVRWHKGDPKMDPKG